MGSIRIEGPPSDDAGSDSVDFDILATDGECLQATQVKSRRSKSPLGVSEAFNIITDLVHQQEARCYSLLIGGNVSPALSQLNDALAGPQSDLRSALCELLAASPVSRLRLGSVSDTDLLRLSRCRVSVDGREAVAIREGLREQLRNYRSRARHGLGEQSAGLLTGYLVAEILRRAANSIEAVYALDDFRHDILISGSDLARANGVKDWGVIVGPMTPPPDISRKSLLDQATIELRKWITGTCAAWPSRDHRGLASPLSPPRSSQIGRTRMNI